MAIYSVRSSFIQRSKGQSAVSLAAYQAGEKIRDERTGQVYNYFSRVSVACANILAPVPAPDWVFDRAQLWNKVEQFEDELINHRYRGHHTSPEKIEKSEKAKAKALSTASTAWSQVIALPRELTEQQNKEWLEQFIKDRFIAKGLIVDYAIHNEKGNPHAHLKVTLRPLDGDTFSKRKESVIKAGNIFDKAGFKETRQMIAEGINGALERYGFDDRVSHLSLKDQGISRLSTLHEGRLVRKRQSQGKSSFIIDRNQNIKSFNLAQYLKHPEFLLKDMALTRAGFTDEDLKQEIRDLTEQNENAYQALVCRLGDVVIEHSAVSLSGLGVRFDSILLKSQFSDGSSRVILNSPLLLKNLPSPLFTTMKVMSRESIEEVIKNLGVLNFD